MLGAGYRRYRVRDIENVLGKITNEEPKSKDHSKEENRYVGQSGIQHVNNPFY